MARSKSPARKAVKPLKTAESECDVNRSITQHTDARADSSVTVADLRQRAAGSTSLEDALGSANLAQYWPLFKNDGWTELSVLKGQSEKDIQAMAEQYEMKPGHKAALLSLLNKTPTPKPCPKTPTPKPCPKRGKQGERALGAVLLVLALFAVFHFAGGAVSSAMGKSPVSAEATTPNEMSLLLRSSMKEVASAASFKPREEAAVIHKLSEASHMLNDEVSAFMKSPEGAGSEVLDLHEDWKTIAGDAQVLR